MMNKGTVGKGVIYLYIEAITMMFSGYIYWLILSKITDPSIIGSSATAISIATIFMVIASIGVAGGIQSYLGKSVLRQSGDIKQLINSSMLIIGLGILGTSLILVFLKDWMLQVFNLDVFTVILLILIILFSSLANLLRAIIIPSLKTQFITASVVISTSVKILLTIFLVLLGFGTTGILVGFVVNSVVSIIILTIAIKRTIYKQYHKANTTKLFKSTKDIFYSSIGFWIPGVFNTIGSQLGTIAVFISNGANLAGVYFIAFSIVTGISMIMLVLSTIAYPVIGSMKDGRKQASWRLIKISLIITVPLSNIMIFYASDILEIFGSGYTTGSSNLQILLLSILPTAIMTGINVLVYAYGNNKQVLIIGLVTSVPRTLLYFIFVPIFEGNGAALTYLVGSIIGSIVAVFIAWRIEFKISWLQVVLISLIPVLIALIFMLFEVNFILEICVALVITYVLLLKLGVIGIEEIEDITNNLPKGISKPLSKTLRGFDKIGKK